jgi:C1A family cysteine protease
MSKVKTKRILNCIPSKGTEKDWDLENALQAGLTATSIPASKDLREDTWWKINDQGSTGSCVGWSSTDSVLRWHLTKAGRIKKTQLLSIRFTWMASKETDVFNQRATTFIDEAGTSLKGALEIQRKYGAVLERSLPFDGSLVGGEEGSFYADAASRKINSYFNLISSTGDKLSSFRRWIANNGPILVCLDVDSTWDAIGSNGKLNKYNAASAGGGHAVALVGYTKDYFIVRNSWGTSWGDKGYAYASNAYTKAAFTEGYGVSL